VLVYELVYKFKGKISLPAAPHMRTVANKAQIVIVNTPSMDIGKAIS